ncbi:MAG: RNA methyltransferase [Burkholderiales bacterium]|nr:RNA methyltransferase [Burkholderiales bacterium]
MDTMREIRSRDNPLVKSLLRLAASARERKRSAMTLLDGEHLLEAYVRSGGGEAEVVAVTGDALRRASLRRLAQTAPARRRVVLPRAVFERISQVENPAGILAMIRTPVPVPAPQRLGDAILLERIQDPGNLGSILRSAAAAGLGRVFLSRGSVLAWSPKVLRSGMGAHFALDIHEDADLAAVASQARGLRVAADPRGETDLYRIDLSGPILWLFGTEGAGLDAASAKRADVRARIPMPGQAESLNLAASVAVCLFEQVRQRNEPGARAGQITAPA